MVIQQASALDSETSTDTKTIFIVDDHPIMRQGLAVLINHEKDLNVCGEAEDAAHALDGILATKPDLALIDISLPGKNGLELIKDLRAMDVYVSILVHSMHDESLYVERVLRAGAQGYITKDEGGSKLMEAIRKVLAGEIYVSPEMSGKIIEIFSGRRASSTNPVEALTDRQFEIFQMIGNGQSTRDIAETLNVSIKTVDAHRDHIKKKLNLRSGTELVRFAVRWVEVRTDSRRVPASAALSSLTPLTGIDQPDLGFSLQTGVSSQLSTMLQRIGGKLKKSFSSEEMF